MGGLSLPFFGFENANSKISTYRDLSGSFRVCNVLVVPVFFL